VEIDLKAPREKTEVAMPEAAFNRAKREAAAKEKADKAKADNDKYLSRGQKLKGEVSKF
jgi:hypothetical protein